MGKRKAEDKGNLKGKVRDINDATSTSSSEQLPLPPSKRARSTSPPRANPELPDVNDLLKGVPIIQMPVPDVISSSHMAHMLFIAFTEVSQDSQWQNVLDLKYKDLKHCQAAWGILSVIVSRRKIGDQSLRTHVCDVKPFNLRAVISHIRPQRRIVRRLLDYLQRLYLSPSSILYFKRPFEKKYCARKPKILLTIMDMYHLRTRYYNRSFPLVQSSGMDKSRMMDHTATLRFTLPLNIHEEIGSGGKAYPPADHKVRAFITEGFDDEVGAVTRTLVFLQALFDETVAELEKKSEDYTKSSGKPQDIANMWYKFMNEGSTADEVGTERTKFYERVVEKAQQLEKLQPANDKNPLEGREKDLKTAAQSLVKHLQKLYGKKNVEFCAIVYFDEAHTLFSPSKGSGLNRRIPYYALMHVLSMISDRQIFFVFLSTNSTLQTFAPNNVLYPSIQVQTTSPLIPPFWELPFDTFCQKFTTEAKKAGALTLWKVCSLGQMTKLGRPMWYSLYQSLPKAEKGKTIDLAETKLLGGASTSGEHADLASLDSRILIGYDPLQTRSQKTQTELIKSHMRCVFNIPKKREFVDSGYLSEPILAEAAGRILNWSRSIKDSAPEISGGERGELVARTLLTVAHDLAAEEAARDNKKRSQSEPTYHRPIRLIKLLEHLLSPEVFKEVCDATPCYSYKDAPTLKDAWVNFSHFVRLADHESSNLKSAAELLKRGAAIQTHDHQPNQDLGVPLFFGSPDTNISLLKTGMTQFQVKNEKQLRKVYPNPELAGKCRRPVLSIVMQLGVDEEKHKGQARVEIMTKERGGDNTPSGTSSVPTDVERRHYSIVLYGCTKETYSCVGSDSNGETYGKLLRKTTLLHDYHRSKEPDALDQVQRLQPDMSGPQRMHWRK